MSLKVLIIEDEIDLAENISEYLIQHGYDVVGIIPTAEDVPDFIAKNDIDLIRIFVKSVFVCGKKCTTRLRFYIG